MLNSIKVFLKFLNWGWFATVIVLAAFAVALFPFEDFSFDYIMRAQVFKVMGKTVLITVPAVLMVGLLAYAVHKLSLWQNNSLGAMVMHACGGVIIPFAFVGGMIRLLYSENIFSDPSHQSDLIFAVFLLIILNFWMRIRIDAALMYKLKLENKQLKDQKFEVLESYDRFKEREKRVKDDLDKVVKHKEDEVTEWQLKYESIRKENVQILLHQEKIVKENELLKVDRQELKEFVNNWAKSLSLGNVKASKYLEIRLKSKCVVLVQEEVAYVETRSEGKQIIEVVTLKEVSYFPSVQSMTVLLRDYFTGMMHVSRNYAVMPDAILGYSDLESNKLLLEVMHLDKLIEVSGVYFERYGAIIIDLVKNIELAKYKI